MNILDENTPESQRLLLLRKRIRVRQVGFDIGRDGMKDDAIIPLLHQQDRPTLFTRDAGFYDRDLCHNGYCLVYLKVHEKEIARYVRRVLRHPDFTTKAKRMGAVIQASPTGLSIWRRHQIEEIHLEWQ